MCTKKIKKIDIHSLVFFICILFIGLVLWKQCRYGFGNVDESLYLAIPYRLCQGDALLTDEWHISQLSSFIIYPLVKIFLLLNKSTDSIILAFRRIYTIIQLCVASILYLKYKKVHKTGAFIGCILFLLYTPYGIRALSYNSIAIQSLALFSIFFYSNNKIELIISGVLFAFSVLCCPYLIIVYFAYLVFYVLCRNRQSLDKYRFLYASIGSICVFILFCIFVLSRADIQKIIFSIPKILEDPDHSYDLFEKINLFFYSILYDGEILKLIIYLLYITIIIVKIDIEKKLSISLLVTFVYLLFSIKKYNYLNMLMVPVFVESFLCAFFLGKEDCDERIKISLIIALVYSFLLNLSSNQILYAISSAFSIAICGGTTNIFYINSRMKKGNLLRYSFLILFVVTQFISETYFRIVPIFWEGTIFENNEFVSFGIDNGIFVSKEKYDIYTNYYYELESIPNNENINVLFVSDKTYLYLMGKWRNSCYSAWPYVYSGNYSSRLLSYYEINSNKLPEFIFVDSEYSDIYVFDTSDYNDIKQFVNGDRLIARHQ